MADGKVDVTEEKTHQGQNNCSYIRSLLHYISHPLISSNPAAVGAAFHEPLHNSMKLVQFLFPSNIFTAEGLAIVMALSNRGC